MGLKILKAKTAPSAAPELGTDLPGKVVKFPAKKAAPECVALTEDDVAEDFVREYGNRLRFDHDRGSWFVYDEMIWRTNNTGLVFDLARKHCRKHRSGSSKMATKKAADAVEHMARRDQRLAVTSDQWDRDPFLLGTPKGTVDLQTGKLREPDPADFITKMTSVAPAPKGTPCSVFMKFLDEITSGDKPLRRVLLQWFGSCLTGDTRDQVLVFIYGTGGNGKSRLVSVVTEIAGDYARTAMMETLTASRYQGHPAQVAFLNGARLVTANETERNQEWSQARITQLTGQDPVTAYFMRQNPFTFVPQFKLTIVGNHMPRLGTVNEAARRRFLVIPFSYKPKHPDKLLMDKLRPEYPAILRMLIDGCLDWQANGLISPEIVTATTFEYFAEQDVMGRWIEDRCQCGPDKKATASALFESFREFSKENGEEAGSMTAFGQAFAGRGFEKKKTGGKHWYIGIGLKPESTLPFSSSGGSGASETAPTP